MSVVDDHVRRLDARVDRVQASLLDEAAAVQVDSSTALTASKLSAIARALSANTASGPQLKPARLLDVLHAYDTLHDETSHAAHHRDGDGDGDGDGYIAHLAWVVAARATVQTFALVTRTLLDQTMPLSDGIYYWNEVLGSRFYTGLYTIQTSPLRMARYMEGVYQRMDSSRLLNVPAAQSLPARWNAFYHLVRESVHQQSLARTKMAVLSPFGQCRSEARRKRAKLKKLREMNACAVGLLIEESLLFEAEEDDTTKTSVLHSEDWQDVISRSTLLIRTVLKGVNEVETDLTEFEDSVFAHVASRADDVSASFGGGGGDPTVHPHWIIQHLISTLNDHLPEQRTHFNTSAAEYGRPRRLIRYWLPATLLLFSSSTILNLLTSRAAELTTWVRELGSTAVDFWRNWIIDPLNRLVGTIRHDERSEVALMGKQSLQTDLASLERMVVDFASDHPADTGGYSPDELDVIRARVKEGDVTPVLTAYERDLRRPFVGTVRGDLVRALLIQVQKTKVDVEVAVGGIDAMLKSQELVFGFIALTPGILVSYATLQWVAGLLGSRRGIRQGKRRGEMLRAIRSVDRVLTAATPTRGGVLSYKDHGLLLCECEILRQRARQVLPGVVYAEFQEDLGELLSVRGGVGGQMRVLERVRWAYGRWMR